MKNQRDEMTDDLHAHGAIELMKHEFVANKQVFGGSRWANDNNNLHPDKHYEAATRSLQDSHGHDHGDDDHHHEWF